MVQPTLLMSFSGLPSGIPEGFGRPAEGAGFCIGVRGAMGFEGMTQLYPFRLSRAQGPTIGAHGPSPTSPLGLPRARIEA